MKLRAVLVATVLVFGAVGLSAVSKTQTNSASRSHMVIANPAKKNGTETAAKKKVKRASSDQL